MIAVPETSIPVFLAPMSGATDAPFRKQAVRFGAPAVVTEMIAGSELAQGRKDMVRRVVQHEGAGPFIVQLAGRDPNWMRQAADICTEAGADVIDINMGCPSRQVTGGQSGAALMRDLDLARNLIEATIEGTSKPVTLKMRLGWSDETLNAPELARIAEGAGVVRLTVHGRTRCQFYNGVANWSTVKDTCDSVDLPVIVNGDINDVISARTAMDQSGADGVMIGRAAMGRPWLIGQVAKELTGNSYATPDFNTQISALCHQIDDSSDLYGEGLGVRIVRKHVSAFIANQADSDDEALELKEISRAVCRLPEREQLKDKLKEHLYQWRRARADRVAS